MRPQRARPEPRPRAPNRRLALDDVHNRAVVSVDDVDHAGAANRSGIERLTAGCRVERGAIEHDAGAAGDVADVDDTGIELGEIRIGVIETLGHECSTGSVMPASRKPLARSRQLSQRPHGRAVGPRIVAAVREAVVEAERQLPRR